MISQTLIDQGPIPFPTSSHSSNWAQGQAVIARAVHAPYQITRQPTRKTFQTSPRSLTSNPQTVNTTDQARGPFTVSCGAIRIEGLGASRNPASSQLYRLHSESTLNGRKSNIPSSRIGWKVSDMTLSGPLDLFGLVGFKTLDGGSWWGAKIIPYLFVFNPSSRDISTIPT